jgi:hypothetical protein
LSGECVCVLGARVWMIEWGLGAWVVSAGV